VIKSLSSSNIELTRQLQIQQQQSMSFGGQMFYQNPVMMIPMPEQQSPMMFNTLSPTNISINFLQTDQEIDAYLQA